MRKSLLAGFAAGVAALLAVPNLAAAQDTVFCSPLLGAGGLAALQPSRIKSPSSTIAMPCGPAQFPRGMGNSCICTSPPLLVNLTTSPAVSSVPGVPSICGMFRSIELTAGLN